MTATATATAAAPGRSYARRISQIERGYLNANATGTPQLIQMVIEGTGRLDAAELADAVRESTAANPGLAVRRKGPNWRADDAALPPVTVLPADAGFTHPFFHRDLDVVAGPVCELGLSEGPVTRLVVRASHIVTDGRGLRHWIEDLFRALRGEQPVGADSTVDDTHFRAAAAPVPAAPVPARVAGFPAILGQGEADGTALWLRRSVAATPSAVTARVGAAVSRLLATDTGRLIIPVDLRRHDREVRSTANLTSQLVLDLHREDRWNRLHSQLLAAMLRKREVASLERDFLRNNPFANSLREAQELDGSRFPCTAILTDHGRIDTELYRTAHFRPTEYYTLPMLVPYAEMFLSTCQIDDRTELTLSCRNRPDARPAAEAVLDEVERALLAVD
ncbi:hypothetical protein [Kitasatospora cineracea]|uniref:Condensation domain-containing protein n=1 Tax=Kitasatospora cineracea TaxID=88074 RepID=A0A3N4S359_9ACTN|nr:hypothetical protein [Kitasatospora cineracea]ROR42865.1 hypothetical protein EDD39_0998 [Kitasatospora cineracea]RPE33360.1 hypothetical protein EDD38_1645 [Kitasatospora cineracea]